MECYPRRGHTQYMGYVSVTCDTTDTSLKRCVRAERNSRKRGCKTSLADNSLVNFTPYVPRLSNHYKPQTSHLQAQDNFQVHDRRS